MCPLIDTEATFSDRQSQLQKQKQNKKTKTFNREHTHISEN